MKLSHDVELLKLHENQKAKQQKIELLEERVRDLGRENEELKRKLCSYGEHEILDLGPKSSSIGNDLKVIRSDLCFYKYLYLTWNVLSAASKLFN